MDVCQDKILQLIIVMGVSGTGKSTLAANLAKTLNFDFVEADDFHTNYAKDMMSCGESITDQMRQDWVDRLCQHLKALFAETKSVVIAYSGLKAEHREQFRQLTSNPCFIMLSGEPSLITQRMTQRKNHFVDASFLQKQLDAMEYPKDMEIDITTINVDKKPEALLRQALEIVQTSYVNANKLKRVNLYVD